MSVSRTKAVKNRTKSYEGNHTMVEQSWRGDVNNSQQSAICNTKDEQSSIHFIVYHFARACVFSRRVGAHFAPRGLFLVRPAISYEFNRFVANQNAEVKSRLLHSERKSLANLTRYPRQVVCRRGHWGGQKMIP